MTIEIDDLLSYSRASIYTPARVIVLHFRVLREYYVSKYVRKANYAHLRVTCAYLRVKYLINIHEQR